MSRAAKMTVGDVMTRDVYAVSPDTSVETAARLLARHRITGLPVVNSKGRPIGVVTLVDLVDPERARSVDNGYPLFYRIAEGELLKLDDGIVSNRGPVADLLSPFVLSIASSSPLVDAAQRLIGESVHRLLVMNGGALVGIVTTTDLLRGFVLAADREHSDELRAR